MNGSLRWQIVTGEYPPQPGGVSDYTHQVARALAEAGDPVCVWAPQAAGDPPQDPGVIVRRLPGRFGPQALWQLSAALRRERTPFRLLIQYVPQMYGWRAMNLPFCLWLASARRRPWVMFHEVAVDFGLTHRAAHNVLGLVTHLMAALVAASADRCFVSVPRWSGMLRRVGRRRPPQWLPIPSNITTHADPVAAAAVRARLRSSTEGLLLGHFGTFGRLITDQLTPLLSDLLTRHPLWSVLLIGRGSEAFARRLGMDRPAFAERIHAAGCLPAGEAADHLASCDLLVQPYPDGASSRRTSLMAGLALGLPIVSTHGASTEPLWQRERLVALAGGTDAALAEAVEQLADSPAYRRELGERARVGYEAHFSLRHTIAVLRECSPPSGHRRGAAGCFHEAHRSAGQVELLGS